MIVGGTCYACPAGYYSGPGANGCSPCPFGMTSLPGSSQCVTKCGAGQYSSNGSCPTCPAGSYSQAGATSCSDCPADTYSYAGAGSCTSCPSGKGSSPRSTSPNQCTDKCPDGRIFSNGNCQVCPAGTFSSTNMCADCPPGTISNAGSKSCVACPGGSVPTSNGNTCTGCPRNTYSNGDNCSPCPAGSTSNPGSSSCGPQPSRRAQPAISYAPACFGHGMMLCEVLSGAGGTECIDILTTLDSCGGCVGPEGEEDQRYSGRDCTAIAHVDEVRCERGSCQVKSCRAGFEPSGGLCVEKAVYVGRNGTHASGTRAKRGLISHHDSF